MVKYYFIFFSLFFYDEISAQSFRETEHEIITDIMETLIENSESTIDYTDIQDQLEFYIEHKINVNSASRFDFQKLFFIDEKTIDAIINHRNEFGKFLSVYEIQSLENIDERQLFLLTFLSKLMNKIFKINYLFLR